MTAVLLTALACATGVLYLLGASVLGYLFAPAARDWLREHPGALGGPVRRALTVTALVAGWPLVATVLGWVWWRERCRCPFGECAMSGWCTLGAERVQALVSVYRCPHRAAPGAPGVRPSEEEASWWAWCSMVPAALLASILGALASIPVPGPGFVMVYAAVTAATVVPLDVLAEDLLRRCAAKLAVLGSARVADG